jgi:hypothetical protein
MDEPRKCACGKRPGARNTSGKCRKCNDRGLKIGRDMYFTPFNGRTGRPSLFKQGRTTDAIASEIERYESDGWKPEE